MPPKDPPPPCLLLHKKVKAPLDFMSDIVLNTHLSLNPRQRRRATCVLTVLVGCR